VGTLLVAAAVAGLALPDGASAPIAIAVATLLVWVVLLAGLASGVLPRVRIPTAALVAGLALIGLAALTALSLGWTDDQGRAFVDVARIAGYLGLFALVVVAVSARETRPLLAGIGIGLTTLAAYALSVRFLPGLFDTVEDPVEFLASPAPGRLSEPIGYWNGLAAAMAMAIVLLGWLAGSSAARLGRVLATAALPLAVLALYLTDSRGGAIAAAAGVAALLVSTPKRVTLLAPLGIGVAGGLALAGLASTRRAFSFGAPTSAGDQEGLEMLAATLVVILIVAALSLLAERRSRRSAAVEQWRALTRRLSSWLPARSWLVAAAAAAALVAGVLAGPALLDDFKEVPPEDPLTDSVSLANGSGRYQFWDAGLDAFTSAPLQGVGASGFSGWWNRNGSLSTPVRDAHSVFVEPLAELGVAGLGLTVVFFGVAVGVGWRRLRALRPETRRRSDAAAAAGILVAGLLVAAVDWTWELPGVFVPTMVAAALLTGAATEPRRDHGRRLASGPEQLPSARAPSAAARRWLAGIVGALGAAAIFAAGVLLVAELELGASRAALERGDTTAAARHARDAATIEPWAAEPRLQLAAVEEFAGNPRAARRWLEDAVARAPFDPEVWRQLSLVSAQLGDSGRALEEAVRAASLSPTRRR
jgi:hypothetical protein